MSFHIVAQESEGGGAALDQVIGMSVAALAVSAGLVWIGYLHRMNRISWLGRLADFAAHRFKRPPWAAGVIFVFASSIFCALFGFIWDVSLHKGTGRDTGPLASPAHYFILIGLFGVFVAAMLGVILPHGKPTPSAVRITHNWYTPVGSVLIAACGLYALIGFPLDDIFHRLFGQDSTLWGPTHLMLIGGGGLSVIAVLLLEYEGRHAMNADTPPDGWAIKFVRYMLFGGLVVGLSVFQFEYDLGIDQFRLVLQPMLIAGAAAIALVAARLTLGPGAAILAALLAIAIRGAVALMVGPLLGAPISWFPLYVGPALVVELLALTPLVKRPIGFGAIAGLGVATAGLWVESLWIDAVYAYPWPTSMWGEALAMAVPVAVLTGVCGALLGVVLTGQRLPRPAVGIAVVVLAVLVTGGAVANGLRISVPEDASATVTLTDLPGTGGHRMVAADVRINPPGLVSDNPEWVTILSWQGGIAYNRGFIIDHLDRVGPGHFRSTEPIPVWGAWKTLLRVQDGTTMAAVPIFMPADPGIGAQQLPAQASMTREFVPEITVLQRERTFDKPAWLYDLGGVVVVVCTLALIAALTWGVGRINGSRTPAPTGTPPRPQVQPPV